MRLTAEDGYQAQRRYSIASAPDDGPPQITVVEVDMGEVSPWMVSVAREEDVFEVRGPFGGWFVWDPPAEGEVLMVGGGSGLVPLMSMLRAGAPARLLVSAREPDDVLYHEELGKRGTRRHVHLHALGAARVGGPHAPRRLPDAARPGRASGSDGIPRVRVRAHRLRRVRRQ